MRGAMTYRGETRASRLVWKTVSRFMGGFAVALLLTVGGCTWDDGLSDASSAAAEKVRTWVPLGTAKAEAQRIMERYRFTCSQQSDATFGRTGKAFLSCTRRDVSSGRIERVHYVLLLLTEDRVSDVKVMGSVGPIPF
jgi:hypothetical protein